MKRAIYLTSTILARVPLAFDTGKAGWKLDKDGKIELKDGNPVWIDANGGEATIEGGAIARLNGEARDLRKAKEDAEKTLLPFKDLDPVIARKAIADLAKIDTKKLIDAGEVDRVRDQMRQEFTAQNDELKNENNTLRGNMDSLRLDNVFANSDFVRNDIAMSKDFFTSNMRRQFKIEDGKIIAYHPDGSRVLSKKNAGEFADPEEAMRIIVDNHPDKERILKAADHSGSGGDGGGGGRGSKRTYRRADLQQMSPAEQANLATAVSKGEANLID